MTSLLDKIRAKRADIKETRAAHTKPYKFKVGKTLISLLPLHTDLALPTSQQNFARDVGLHYIKNPAGEMVAVVADRSISFPGTACPVRAGLQDMMRYANSIGDDALATAAKESMAKRNLAFNVFVHADPDRKAEDVPQLCVMSQNFYDDIASVLEDYLTDPALEDVACRWKDRLLLTVERTGTGKNDTTYKVYPAPKRIDLDPSVMSKAVNIEEYVRGQMSDESVTKALSYVSTVTGKPLAGSGYASALTGGAGSSPAPAIAGPASDVVDVEAMLSGAPTSVRPAPALESTRTADAAFTSTPAPTPAASGMSDSERLLAEIDGLAA